MLAANGVPKANLIMSLAAAMATGDKSCGGRWKSGSGVGAGAGAGAGATAGAGAGAGACSYTLCSPGDPSRIAQPWHTPIKRVGGLSDFQVYYYSTPAGPGFLSYSSF